MQLCLTSACRRLHAAPCLSLPQSLPSLPHAAASHCLPLPRAPTAVQCLHKAIAICKPGTPYREIGEVITKHAKAHG